MDKELKNILLLGGYGFLGTNVMKYVDANFKGAYRFVVFDKFDHHLAGVKFDSVEKSYAGDFTDSVLLERIFQENKIDIVLHSLSTTVPVDSCNARFDVESNLIPTLDVLGLMVKYGVKDIVYLSSGGAIYGVKAKGDKQDAKGFREEDDVFPVSSYGVVKLAIEKYMMQYAQLYDLQPLILRLSNPYGPYHYSMKQGVVNVAMTKALKGETLEIWGSGEDKKDYIYVEDYVAILFKLMAKGDKAKGKVLNIASGQTFSVNEIADVVKNLVPELKVEHKNAQKFDASHFELNTDKLKSIIGEYDFLPFEDGVKRTYEWTKTVI